MTNRLSFPQARLLAVLERQTAPHHGLTGNPTADALIKKGFAQRVGKDGLVITEEGRRFIRGEK